VGRGTRAAVVANACDFFESPRLGLAREVDDLSRLGFSVSELDLRDFFGQPERLRSSLTALDLLWVTGGNSFVLSRAMHASGFDIASADLVRNGELVYGGYSAGVCAIAATLKGIHLMDDPTVLPEGYPADAIAAPLRWVPWTVVPHWRSDHPEASAAQAAVDHLLTAGLPVRTLRDGQAIVVDGDAEAIF
jgi:dipeptidase E